MSGGELPFGASIRDLRADDVQRLLAFINPLIAEDTYIDMSGRPLTPAEESAFVQQRLILDQEPAEFAIGTAQRRANVMTFGSVTKP